MTIRQFQVALLAVDAMENNLRLARWIHTSAYYGEN